METLIKLFNKYHGFVPNLDNPHTFSEKLQWIKLYGEIERYSNYVDKYEVRQFVKSLIGELYVIPLIGVYESTQQIHFQSLPKSFAMKATHGSGWNIIVKDKHSIDWELESQKMDMWLNSNYGDLTGEKCYKPLKGRIVIEELITDPSEDLKDYKFFCFQGNPAFIQLDSERFSSHKRDLYDLNWTKLPLNIRYENLPKPANRPKHLDKMISIAQSLSQSFAFVRVDLYHTDDRIYFGELTFVPGNGLERFDPPEYDVIYGDLLDLNRYIV